MHRLSVACLEAAATFCSAQLVPDRGGTPAPQGWHCRGEEHSTARCTSQQASAQTRNGRSGDDVQKRQLPAALPRLLPAAGLCQHTRPLLPVRALGTPGWPLPAAKSWRYSQAESQSTQGHTHHAARISTDAPAPHTVAESRAEQQPLESLPEPPPHRGSRHACQSQSKQGCV